MGCMACEEDGTKQPAHRQRLSVSDYVLMNDSKSNNDKRTLYIDEINVSEVNKWKFRVKLRLLDGDTDENVNLAAHGSRWTPSRSCEVPVSGFIQISLKAGISLGGIGLGKQKTTKDITGSRISEEFLKRRGRAVAEGSPNPADSHFSISEYVTFGDHSVTITLKLRPSHAVRRVFGYCILD
ncbi:hypothetical protein FRC19_006158 [Serendipita sp. 401]|nr:hypothetical protein FRC19_006158 [Serendipita sp. 401]